MGMAGTATNEKKKQVVIICSRIPVVPKRKAWNVGNISDAVVNGQKAPDSVVPAE